ncbi:hypothetical protein BKA64DRAFT_711387 [Cadophora sp. MPI-SDFR-AT-0126]|nr:hypothetical protein BKA64DRAFT_711387 [Leotiomycetes sp. MPI-SDFR-AT-0126]
MSNQAESAASPANESWLQELQTFAKEFKRGDAPSVFPGDVGIGSVKYRTSFSKDEGINEKGVKLLEDIINLEEVLGNYWIKVEALLMKATFGREDPIEWLPAARRCAIRYELQEMTAKVVSSNGLAQGTRLASAALVDIIRVCSQFSNPANPAELAVVAAYVPRTVPSMTADGIILSNKLDAEDGIEILADLVDRHRSYKVKVDAVHGLLFKLLHGSEEKIQPNANKEEANCGQRPTGDLLKDVERYQGGRDDDRGCTE